MLADGAKWIWAEVEKNLPGAAGVLDIYHASEHLHAAAVALHGDGPGGRGVVRGAAAGPCWSPGRRACWRSWRPSPGDVSELVGYLGPHADHTAYRRRLAEGRSIGSGMVEGACKTAIGRRLKQTGARWRVRRLERMAALCCLAYGDQFDAYWKQAAG